MSKNSLKFAVEYFLHPLLLAGAVLCWYSIEDAGLAFVVAITMAHIILRICENIYPNHADWKQSPNEILVIVGISIAALVLTGVIEAIYESSISLYLSSIKEILGMNFWPTEWPLVVQIFLVYFLSEFIFYWIHRAIHNFSFLWRLSGHGFHHSFKNLHAINFITAHPFELFFLALPSLILSYLLGAPEDAAFGGVIILLVNASFAHANIKSTSKWLGFVFTTSTQHSRHHSAVFEESNTNYSCNAIIFDRLFGTYSEGPIVSTGIGPSEPTLLEKLLLPFREPGDIKTAPSSKQS